MTLWSDSYVGEIGFAYYILGRSAEAVPVLKRFIDAYPGFVTARWILAAAYIELGMMDQARAKAAELMSFNPHFSLEEGFFKGPNPPAAFLRQLPQALPQPAIAVFSRRSF